MSLEKIAELHERGLISDELLEKTLVSILEKTSAPSDKALQKALASMIPAPTASSLKQVLVKSRLARPNPMVRNTDPRSDWNTLPGWYGKVKGKKDLPRMYEGDPVHGGPRIEATPVGNVVGYGGTALAGLAATDAIGEKLEKRKRRKASKKGFKSMLRENPDIAKMDTNKVRKSFKTLTRLAPDLSTDPQISGAFVRRTAGDYAELGVDPKMARDLLDAQNAYLRSKSDRGSLKGALQALGIGAQAL